MATGEVARPGSVVGERVAGVPQTSVKDIAVQVLMALASLRLTVVLFGLSICLVFFGTLAQKDADVFTVQASYFRVWIAHIELRTFERFVQIFNRDLEWNLTGTFPFLGGSSIGLVLLLNLFAAHIVRFKIAAEGRRLYLGLGVLALGIGAVGLAIASGMNNTIESELSPAFCQYLWQAFRLLLVVTSLVGANVLRLAYGQIRSVEWRLLLGVEIVVAALAVLLLVRPDLRLDDSGLRLLWQFFKGAGAGLVLLAGCIMVFRKRAGIVLLHGGVALIMLGEVWTAFHAQESQVTIPEGETATYSSDGHKFELAVIDHSGADTDRVTVIPASLLESNVGATTPIGDANLPFNVQVNQWLPQARLTTESANANPATAGFGQKGLSAMPAASATEDNPALPAAYISLVHKETGKSLGTYLVATQLAGEQPVEVDGRTYDIALRYEQVYWPFNLSLIDFRFDRYTGTNKPKNYSSLVQLRDPAHEVDREVKIWMNNPLRYAGFTVYQADFEKRFEKASVLNVVSNSTWMTPYVGCMLVAIALASHFGGMLYRFVRRRAEENVLVPIEKQARALNSRKLGPSRAAIGAASSFGRWFPALVVAFFAVYLASKMPMPSSQPSEMQIYEFAKLPVSYEGRIKPYDSLAINSLQFISGRQELIIPGANDTETKRPAISWLLDAISGKEVADEYRIFRVENTDLLQTLGLEARPGSYRYSLTEIMSKIAKIERPANPAAAATSGTDASATPATKTEEIPELQRQVALAEAVPEDERSLFQNKVLQLATKKHLYDSITFAFRSPPLSSDQAGFAESVAVTQKIIAMLTQAQAPCAVPPAEATTAWSTLLSAEFDALRARVEGRALNPATISLGNILSSYARGDTSTFNQQLIEYRKVLANYDSTLAENSAQLKRDGVKAAEIYSQSKSRFEVFFNHFSPFFYCYVLYLAAFVLGAMSWLGWTEPLRRGSNWLLWFTFIVHTLALIGRIYISGRPPVTNLYSAAVFIGWGAVLMGLVFESIYRLGLGNLVAAVGGFLTLLVAHFLSMDGDTLIVMTAVLDTQFWLATHVVCITLGYATTYVAGLFGILYVVFAHVYPVLKDGERKELTRMTYGTLCFAILFSFIGTVLGGLWGDDSWGRFWGWDPKENGALIIVLYNAIGLHARWGGLVKARGLALLTIGGNIVVTWSYFGVNELNTGLHSYGASEKSTAMWLLVFAMSQLAFIAIGLIPQRWFAEMWGSQRRNAA